MAIYYRDLEINRPSFLGGGKWILKNLSDITIIFGRNGLGKSILLRKILEQDKKNRHYICPERAGNINFEPAYMLEELNPEARANRRNRNFVPYYRQGVVGRLQAFLSKRGSFRNERIPCSPEILEEFISELLPQFKFEITGENPPYRLISSDGNRIITNIEHLSSGESEIFCQALDALTICGIWELDNQKERILLIDEPDLHLHPELQQALAKFLVELANRFSAQIIIATHSTTLLSSLGFYGREKTNVVYLTNATEEQKAIKFNDILQELSFCLGGHALMGPLFTYPLLLVEGEDDFIIWSHACRYGVLKFAVIPCNGETIEKYAQTLVNIFSSIIEEPNKPLVYKLRDGDVGSTKVDNKYIKSLTLNCREIENLYLTDEILSELGTTWDSAKEKIRVEAEKYGTKKELLKNVITQDRRNVDLKNLMKELVSILDPKLVDWKIRLARYLGCKVPNGQLKEFLGEEIVSTFWNNI